MKSNEVEKGSEPHFSNLKQSEQCSSGSIILIQVRKYESESMDEMIHEINQITLNYGYGIN